MTLEQTESLMRYAGGFADFAKIMVGTARLYPRDYLKEKLAVYKKAQVRPFIGGQFAEYVLANQGRQIMPRFFAEAVELGFETIEISDNCVPLKDETRVALIQEARAAGLSVLGEVGAKDRKSEAHELVAQAKIALDAGAEMVLVEAAEFLEGGKLKVDLIEELSKKLDMTRAMIELPGTWISGVSLSQVEDIKKLLVKTFGPDVNIANVKPEDLMGMEAMRCGLWTVGPHVEDPV